ncbi:hypothetical protein GCM10028864_06860 [Microlunatus parietis]
MDQPEVEPERRLPPDRGLSPWALLIVLAGVLAGLGYAVLGGTGAWRVGSMIIGAALGVGGLLRLFLPKASAGLLAVRARGFDVTMLILAGAAVIALALVIPSGR